MKCVFDELRECPLNEKMANRNSSSFYCVSCSIIRLAKAMEVEE